MVNVCELATVLNRIGRDNDGRKEKKVWKTEAEREAARANEQRWNHGIGAYLNIKWNNSNQMVTH